MTKSRTRIDRDYLFANFVSLAIVALAVRWIQVAPSGQRWLLPILAYQDLLICAGLAWLFDAAFRWSSHRRAVTFAAWFVCVAYAILLGLHLLVYAKVRHAFTYRMFLISENFRGIEGSIPESVAPAREAILGATLSVIALSEGWWGLARGALARLRITFESKRAMAMVFVFAVVGHYGANHWVGYPPAAVSPAWALASSIVYDSRPTVSHDIPAELLSDFRPASNRYVVGGSFDGATKPKPWRPMNVLMVVMESVGVRQLQLCGAPFANSPNLVRLAQHGVLFDHVYAAEATSSSAMAGLFCSLYPYHDWMSVTRLAPDLGVTGLGEPLMRSGYRTGLMCPVPLVYDKDDIFLRGHGFREVIDQPHRAGVPLDSEMVANAIEWIRKDRRRPFFLTLWMTETHHPYLTKPVHDYHVSDAYLNRYLNGIEATDSLIGRLTQTLDSMGLTEDTLLVVTGDHGEAFGEHQETGHGFTVYDEEVHVPLLIVNPRLFQHPRVIESVGRQIDIPPTVLNLMGYQSPGEWQGSSLLSAGEPRRAYMFAAKGDYVFGVVDGSHKYICDFDRREEELFDLSSDRDEQHSLGSLPNNAAALRDYHLSIEAWLSFQNDYIRSLIPARE